MHVYLIGYRGSGKTTVGKMVAQRLGWRFWDTDESIEAEAGRTIAEIFKNDGESKFRELEQVAIERIGELSSDPAVVALGGGAVLKEENRCVLVATGHRVWLSGSPKQLYERISSDERSTSMRPNLTDSGGYAEVEAVLAEREPIYRGLASLNINTDGKSPDEIVEEILLWAKSLA